MAERSDRPSRVLASPDPRATVAWLRARLEQHTAAVRADPRRLARPLRLVVPHRVARRRLSADLVVDEGRALAGVAIQTLDGLALELLERAGRPAPRGERLSRLVADRAARRRPELARVLADLDDAFAAVHRGLAELAAAGLRAEHAPALLEHLEDPDTPAGPFPARRRAQALVELAVDVEREAESRGSGGRPALLGAAVEALERAGELGCADWVVVADGEERGPALDLIESLARRGATVLVEAAALPDGTRPPTGPALERLGALPSEPLPPSAPTRLRSALAPDPESEARGALELAREVLVGGARPERIALVAADPRRHAADLRVHAERLGLPLSAASARGALDPRLGPLLALLELLERAGRAPVSRLLDLVAPRALAGDGATPEEALEVRHDLRLGLAALGVARVDDLARLDPRERLGGRSELALPARRGATAVDDDPGAAAGGPEGAGADEGDGLDPDEDGPAEAHPPGADARRLERRQVSAAALGRAAAAARTLLAGVERSAGDATADEHLARILGLVRERAGWTDADPAVEALADAGRAVAEDLPPDLALSGPEWVALLDEEVERRARVPLGGRGGGVQVLGLDEARCGDFDLVVLLGLERDALPRPPREDALLPDRVRDRLREVLPELALARDRTAADLRAVAALLGAAPTVVLSRATADVEGRPLAPSPLLARLGERAPEGDDVLRLPPALGARRGSDAPRPAFEHWVAAGLAGRREDFAELAALARAELDQRREPTADERRAGEARAAALAAFDARPLDGAVALDAFSGVVGAAGAFPSTAPIYATTLEGVARCGWQTFLRKRLGLEPAPDPLAVLPSVDARVVGNVVHRTLERWYDGPRPGGGAPPRTLAEARALGGWSVPPPTVDQLETLLEACAREQVLEEGLAHPGLARVAAAQARPMLRLAVELDWPAGEPVTVLGTELEGECALSDSDGRPWAVRFRADRVDLVDAEEGELALVDYKTGRPASQLRTPGKRHEFYTRVLARGERLQAMLYARVGGRGSYVFLGQPEQSLERELRCPAFDLDEAVRQRALDEAAAVLLDGLGRGVLAPRLSTPRAQENPACKYCELSAACVRGDSGARARHAAFVERRADGAPRDGDGPLEDLWLRLFRLPAAEPPTGGTTEESE